MYSVLVVEDDRDYNDILTKGLNDSGYAVKSADSAKIGLSLTQQHQFDLIICDVLMPEMDGFEFLLEIKKLNLDVKFIMISGGGVSKNTLYLDNSIALGSDAVLAKPFTIDKLDALIKSIL